MDNRKLLESHIRSLFEIKSITGMTFSVEEIADFVESHTQAAVLQILDELEKSIPLEETYAVQAIRKLGAQYPTKENHDSNEEINLELQLIHLSTGAAGDCRFGECKWYTEDLMKFMESYAATRVREALEEVNKPFTSMAGKRNFTTASIQSKVVLDRLLTSPERKDI